MDWASLLGHSKAAQELTQYPDKKLYKAATLLRPEERPTVPVRLYDDPDKLYDEVLSKFGGARLSKNAAGVVPFDKSAIYLSRKAPEYQNSHTLAASMGHEQVHASTPRWDRREIPAYERQLAIIDRFRQQNQLSPAYRQAVADYLEKLRRTGQQ